MEFEQNVKKEENLTPIRRSRHDGGGAEEPASSLHVRILGYNVLAEEGFPSFFLQFFHTEYLHILYHVKNDYPCGPVHSVPSF